MASETLSEHPALQALPPGLRFQVSVWIEDLAKAALSPDVEEVLENLDSLVFGRNTAITALSPEDRQTLQDWLEAEEHEQAISRLLKEALQRAGKTRSIPRATPEQIRIVLESQEEVGIFWSQTQLQQMTRWQVDALIKGIMVRSEVKRATGSYDYPIRRLRQAVRADLQAREPEPYERKARHDSRSVR